MAQRCSLFGIQAIPCGESRGERSIVDLVECNDDITAQLATCHLSRSGLKESELILARAGLFHLTEEQIRNIKVCPSHRYNLGRFWRPRITCQHPSHSGFMDSWCSSPSWISYSSIVVSSSKKCTLLIT